jgi:hypothetical protein
MPGICRPGHGISVDYQDAIRFKTPGYGELFFSDRFQAAETFQVSRLNISYHCDIRLSNGS